MSPSSRVMTAWCAAVISSSSRRTSSALLDRGKAKHEASASHAGRARHGVARSHGVAPIARQHAAMQLRNAICAEQSSPGFESPQGQCRKKITPVRKASNYFFLNTSFFARNFDFRNKCIFFSGCDFYFIVRFLPAFLTLLLLQL